MSPSLCRRPLHFEPWPASQHLPAFLPWVDAELWRPCSRGWQAGSPSMLGPSVAGAPLVSSSGRDNNRASPPGRERGRRIQDCAALTTSRMSRRGCQDGQPGCPSPEAWRWGIPEGSRPRPGIALSSTPHRATLRVPKPAEERQGGIVRTGLMENIQDKVPIRQLLNSLQSTFGGGPELEGVPWGRRGGRQLPGLPLGVCLGGSTEA